MTTYGLKKGNPKIRAVGALAFGPDEVLFVADTREATVTAIDVQDTADSAPAAAFDLEALDTRLAAFLGCAETDVAVRDIAVHPRTHNVYVSVMRGRGDE